MPKKQKLKNEGNYVGNLTGKFQEQRLQDNRTRVSFVTLARSYSHFCRNSREPPLVKRGLVLSVGGFVNPALFVHGIVTLKIF